MTKIESFKKDPSLRYLGFSVVIVCLAMIIAVLLYRHKFGGDLAVSSEEWSNFGGYVGGIFGPLISFVTLLAVLKTVYMQRELLDAQQKEFNLLMDKQDEQLVHAKSEANRTKVQAYQATLLNALATFTVEFKDEASEMLDAAEKVRSSGLKALESVHAVNSYRRRADIAREKVAAFTVLAFELSVNEYEKRRCNKGQIRSGDASDPGSP